METDAFPRYIHMYDDMLLRHAPLVNGSELKFRYVCIKAGIRVLILSYEFSSSVALTSVG
jgi:hypothetical protein